MASVGKNGQPSMEEILASIRRIVADEPSGPVPLIDLNRKPIDRQIHAAASESRVDESPDFDLPNMFRPGHDANEWRAKAEALKRNGKAAPIGRLTDAIRSVTTNGRPASRATQDTAEPVRQQTQPLEQADKRFGIRPRADQSLSTLGATERRRPVLDSAHVPNGHATNDVFPTSETQPANTEPEVAHPSLQPAAPAPMADGSEPASAANPAFPVATAAQTKSTKPRVMAPFRDTRMNRMSSAASPAPETTGSAPDDPAPKPEAESVAQNGSPQSAQIGAIVPGALDMPGRDPERLNGHARQQDSVAAPTQPQSNPHGLAATTGEPNPPPIPAETENASQPHKIEDATADLLRPMLRQWLSENMPRMVEKALHIEVAQSVGSPKTEED